jgi:hypothetical protein
MHWLDLLERAIAQAGAGRMGDVAARLGYAKSTLSLVRHGRYIGSTANIEAAVLRVYGQIQCPHLGHELSAQDCASYASRPTPTSSAPALRHWSACQECPHRPQEPRHEHA